ncbi:MAG: UvrD-helicase domain-containing protein, partial [Calditrichia bacterium]|nr:UvrD-helicase domain-containing protein [Calditrichia bacterium]
FDQAVSKVYWEYGVRLRHNNAMDFDDLLNNVIKLFKENPDIMEKYQNKFDHVLIDEYQDTNVAQFEIIKMLGIKHQNVCVVGDDDQSIYKWRGAEVKNVLKFADFFPEKTTFRLEQNYRSTPQIVEIANSLIIHNKSRLEKELWTKNPAGDKPVLLTLQNPRQEAQKIVSKIKDLRASDGFDYKDMAILYRTNAQSRYFEEELRKNNIHYLIFGGMRFYERKEIKDMVAYLRMLVNPLDSVSFQRIINVPARKIGAKSLETLFEIATRERTTHWDIIQNFDKFEDEFRGNPPFAKFAELVNSWMERIEEMELPQIFEMVLQESGLYDLYHQELITESIDRLENLEQLKTSMVEFEESNGENATLENYLQQIS